MAGKIVAKFQTTQPMEGRPGLSFAFFFSPFVTAPRKKEGKGRERRGRAIGQEGCDQGCPIVAILSGIESLAELSPSNEAVA